MSDLDLERLGALWREDPPASEVEWMRRSALQVRRRARRGQMIETGAALAVAGLIVALIAAAPAMRSVVAGTVALAILLFSHMRQRRLRALELQSLTGSTEEMLDQSIARVEATRKRNRFGLIGMAPAFALGLAFAHLSVGGTARSIMREQFGHWSGLIVNAVVVVVILAATLYLILDLRKSKRELERLRLMRESYWREQEREQL